MAFNAKKSAQTIAYLAIRSGGRINILKAMKLLYLADRESMARYGFPILDDIRVSMPRGPVNSGTYACANGEIEAPEWSKLLQDREDHDIALANSEIKLEDLDELSEADIEVLDHILSNFGHMDRFALADWTHDPSNIPEWENPNGSSYVIPEVRILNYLGVENASEQARTIKEMSEVDKVLRSLRS